MRDFQVRTEAEDGTEEVEVFDSLDAATTRYNEICEKRRKEDDPEGEYLHDIEHIELIEVLIQDAF